MTLPRYDAIVAHWRTVPPLSVSAAAIAGTLGVGRPAQSKRQAAPAEKEQDVQGLIDLLGGAAGFSTAKPAWLKEAANG